MVHNNSFLWWREINRCSACDAHCGTRNDLCEKTIVPIILLLAGLVLCTGCTQTSAPPAAGPVPTAETTVPAPVTSLPAATGYTDLTPAQAKDLIATEKNLVIIDVSPYYDNGHLPGAISIPLAMLDAKIPTLDKTKTYLVYCHADGPSISGSQKLVDAGFTKVYRLAGNYAAWTAAGYPVST
ncbi:MAG: rhodanese-like domain-containing protein [Methanoregula sp.]